MHAPADCSAARPHPHPPLPTPTSTSSSTPRPPLSSPTNLPLHTSTFSSTVYTPLRPPTPLSAHNLLCLPPSPSFSCHLGPPTPSLLCAAPSPGQALAIRDTTMLIYSAPLCISGLTSKSSSRGPRPRSLVMVNPFFPPLLSCGPPLFSSLHLVFPGSASLCPVATRCPRPWCSAGLTFTPPPFLFFP
ncbi:hypothetical protein NL676_008550 [Syzygium grande]|nr:hypothetical protein NL676_008550 [Syzygium grande]